MKFDLILNPQDPISSARQAEADDLDGLWTTEVGSDPYLPLALAASSTSRVTLGTAIAVAFPRSPLVHATVAWDLNRMAPGRVVLGLGTQVRAHNVRRYGVPFDSPVARLRDMIRAVKAIWRSWADGTDLDYHGEFYTHDLMPPFFRPVPAFGPPPRIFVAAVTESMLRMAGAEADGIHIHPMHTSRTLDELTLPTLQSAALKAGRDIRELELCASTLIGTGRSKSDVERAREVVRESIAFYASTPSYRPLLALHGWGQRATTLNQLSREGRWHDMAALVDDEMINEFSVCTTWDGLAEALFDRYAIRVDRLYPYGLADLEVPWPSIARELRSGIAQYKRGPGRSSFVTGDS